MGCNRVKAVNKYMAVQGMCVMRTGEINTKNRLKTDSYVKSPEQQTLCLPAAFRVWLQTRHDIRSMVGDGVRWSIGYAATGSAAR
jgi:hypothetical protein